MLLLIGLYVLSAGVANGDRVIGSDDLIEGDHIVPAGSTTVLQDGARLIVRGDLDVAGRTLSCEGGPPDPARVATFPATDGERYRRAATGLLPRDQ